MVVSPLLQVGWFPRSYVEVLEESNSAVDKQPEEVKPEVVMAKYDYAGQEEGDLSFVKGDLIKVTSKNTEDGGWWRGELGGISGVFPSTYVQPVPPPEQPSPVPVESPVPSGSAPAAKKRLVGRVVASFRAEQAGQLTLSPGQLVLVRQQEPSGWWEGELQSRRKHRQAGWFPANRVELLPSSSSTPTTSSASLVPVPRVPRSVSAIALSLILCHKHLLPSLPPADTSTRPS